MILIYGYYPFPVTVRGGWMKRIAAVDALFADRQRTYVFPAEPGDARDYRLHQQESVHTDRLPNGVRFYRPDLRFAAHQQKLTELVEQAEFIYAHTSHSAQHLLPYYATGKIVTDVHGIAPEEERMQGAPERARFYESFEETMVRQSAALVTVTDAMAQHFRRKYPGLNTPFLHLPILEDVPRPKSLERAQRNQVRVVYAGGLQRWQNVELMVASAARTQPRYEFVFCTHQIAELHAVLDRHGMRARAKVSCEDTESLGALYAGCDFGFVLRDDDPVNRVSCPTKLTEYLAYGVIPIVSLVEIGDFAAMGYRYVTLADFVAERLPDHATLNAMRRENRAIYERMQEAHAKGTRAVSALRAPPAQPVLTDKPGLFLASLDRCSLPLDGLRLEARFGDGTAASLACEEPLRGARRTLALPDAAGRTLTYLRWLPGHGPFVTSPMRVTVVDGAGREHAVETRGSYRVDRYGNWVFLDRGAWLEVASCAIADARAVHVDYEFLLRGPETWIAVDPEVVTVPTPMPRHEPADLQELRSALHAAQAEVASLRTSLSWRMTGPVRALANALARGRHRAN